MRTEPIDNLYRDGRLNEENGCRTDPVAPPPTTQPIRAIRIGPQQRGML
jgi:hypothetical protein